MLVCCRIWKQQWMHIKHFEGEIISKHFCKKSLKFNYKFSTIPWDFLFAVNNVCAKDYLQYFFNIMAKSYISKHFQENSLNSITNLVQWLFLFANLIMLKIIHSMWYGKIIYENILKKITNSNLKFNTILICSKQRWCHGLSTVLP